MHQYLRAIGFGCIRKSEDFEKLVKDAVENYQTEETAAAADGLDYSERRKSFADQMGLLIRGTYDESDHYRAEYCIPYFTGRTERYYDDVFIERHAEKESYAGICDDMNLGVSLIFYIQNITEYLNQKKHWEKESMPVSVALSGLCAEGRILMPVYQKTPVVSELRSAQEHTRMLQAARDGDEDAIENLTLEDMDTYSMISRRIEDEDLFSIVTTHFMPCGVECDHYNVMGEILQCDLRKNNRTGEKIWVMSIDTNGIVLDVCINKEDLLGEPKPGRRFRGIIWLQGLVHFEEKW